MEEQYMTDTKKTDAVVTAGMYWLKEKLGVLNTQIFLSAIQNNTFDYTDWRQNQDWYNEISPQKINDDAVGFAVNNTPSFLREKSV
jgi:hypothetical protein